jgi:hypothetical protein
VADLLVFCCFFSFKPSGADYAPSKVSMTRVESIELTSSSNSGSSCRFLAFGGFDWMLSVKGRCSAESIQLTARRGPGLPFLAGGAVMATVATSLAARPRFAMSEYHQN